MAALATPALAQQQLVSPPLAGFVVGYEAANAAKSIREEVPAGETVEDWSAMVTTQRFAVVDPVIENFAPAFLGGLDRSCPGASHSDVEISDHHGVRAVQFMATCPRNPASGTSETMLVLAFRGKDAVFVKQVAFRGTYRGDRAWAPGFLGATRLCDGACD